MSTHFQEMRVIKERSQKEHLSQDLTISRLCDLLMAEVEAKPCDTQAQFLLLRKQADYIKPCSISAPDLTTCVIMHGSHAIPALLKGDPTYKLQPLVPFHVDKLELKPSNKLALILRDGKFYGLDTVNLIGAAFDLENKHIQLDFTAKSLKIEANYNISGQILVLPISGDGDAKFQFDDNFMEYSFDYDLVKRADGFTYFHNLRPKVYFNITKAHYHFDNLFNGNRELGESTNKLLNENSEEILSDFREAMTQILTTITTNIAKAYLTVVPYNEIFLP